MKKYCNLKPATAGVTLAVTLAVVPSRYIMSFGSSRSVKGLKKNFRKIELKKIRRLTYKNNQKCRLWLRKF